MTETQAPCFHIQLHAAMKTPKLRTVAHAIATAVFAMTGTNAFTAEVHGKGPTLAATVNLPSANGYVWDVNDQTGNVIDGGYDAFDDYGGLRVQISDSTNTVLTASQPVGWSGMSLSGTTLTTTAPFVASGISVTRKMTALPGTNLLRTLDSLTNTSSATRVVRVAWGSVAGDLGSDSNTMVAGTSSGDLAITTADNWMVSIEGTGPTSTATDPVVGVAWSNRSAAVFIGSGNTGDALTAPFLGNGDDGFSPVYVLTLAPGQTVNLLHFLYRGLAEDNAPPLGGPIPASGSERLLAQSVMNSVVANPPVSDLSGGELALVANWSLSTPQVPVLPAGLLALLAGALLVGGARKLQPRK